MGNQSYAPASSPPERPDTHCMGGWVGPRAGLDGCEKFRPNRDSIPNLPARKRSLYRLSYPGPLGFRGLFIC